MNSSKVLIPTHRKYIMYPIASLVFGIASVATATDQVTRLETFDGVGAIWVYEEEGVILIPLQTDDAKHLFRVRGDSAAIGGIQDNEGFFHVELSNQTLTISDNSQILFIASHADQEGAFHATEIRHQGSVDAYLRAYRIAPADWIVNIGLADILLAPDIDSYDGDAEVTITPVIRFVTAEADVPQDGTRMSQSKKSPPRSRCRAGGRSSSSCSIGSGDESCSVTCTGTTCACCNTVMVNNIATVVCECIDCKQL